MISGPKVDIYVGSRKKHYNVPKLLLCHYSSYFDCCFNGSFKEAKTQKLELPEDKVEDFEILLEYMLRGTITECILFTQKQGQPIQRCMNFLEYADRYSVREAYNAVHEPLKKILEDAAALHDEGLFKGIFRTITPSDIELVFRVAPKDSPLRSLVTKGALAAMGSFKSDAFKKQEQEVDGFAAELLFQIRICVRFSTKWENPLTRKVSSV
jgi:hypothetical protein